VNNNFYQFLESLKIDPKESKLKDVLNHKNLTIAKFEQNTHYPDPYTIKVNRFEVSHYINEETTDYYDFQHVSIVDKDDAEQAALIILHDKTEDRLNDLKRNDMINIIVHELKNPITGVIGLSNIMLENDNIDKDEQQVLLNEIKLSGERMNDLVNRFLEIQRLESGRISIDFENVDVLKVIRNVCSITHPLLSEKNLETKVIKEGKDFTITANSDLLFDAIQNILSNAVKYGDAHRVIEIAVYDLESKLKISITDYGYGISLEDQKKIFDKFYRVKSNIKSAREKGTGLGLAYVREIMNRHHGEIELESNEKIGSRFTLVFPKVKTREVAYEV
jgi:two-component system phosphate regulon sensor histidine kinase PhoR